MSDDTSNSKSIPLLQAIIAGIFAIITTLITVKDCDNKPPLDECSTNKVNSYPNCIQGKWKIIEGELNGKQLSADSVSLISGYLNLEFKDNLLIFSGGKGGKALKVDTAKYIIDKNSITIDKRKNANIKIGYIRQDSMKLHFTKSSQDYLEVKLLKRY